MKPKTFQEMMSEMLKDSVVRTPIEDIQPGSALKSLLDSLESSMYYGYPRHEVGLRKMLKKLGIKSAMEPLSYSFGNVLPIESLEATLKQVTFDDTHLKLWKNLGKTKL